MAIARRTMLGSAVAASLVRPGRAQSAKIRIGLLSDLSGTYRDDTGMTGVACARQALEDFGTNTRGLDVEIIFADHQNKPDIGSSIARQWYDTDKVDMIIDVPTSSVALAISQVSREKGKIHVNTGAATADLTSKACSPNTIHWLYDTWMLANGTGKAVVQHGGTSWFFLTSDYAFGLALERDTEAVVLKNGGKVLGKVRHPLATQDFSSFLLQAQASKAKVIGLANAGGDTTNAIKQAYEFGIVKGGQTLAGLLVFLPDVHSLGLEKAQGLYLTETFYWDLNDQTRTWSKRFAALNSGKYPSMDQAGVYAGILHYLKAVDAAKTDDGTKVAQKMKDLPTDDILFGKGSIRKDGRKLHPAYLFEVKKPSESKYPYDYYKLLATIPADQAFRPMSEGECPFVKN